MRKIALITGTLLLALGIWHASVGSEFVIDVIIALLALIIITRYAKHMHQDRTSFLAFCSWILIHCAGLYGMVVFGIEWDKIMHLIGGLALAIMAHRLLRPYKLGTPLLPLLVVLVPLGIGAFHEIVEWLGYGYLGAGDGFLFYGEGDFGEWRNTVLDMIFNLVGAVAIAIGTWKKS